MFEFDNWLIYGWVLRHQRAHTVEEKAWPWSGCDKLFTLEGQNESANGNRRKKHKSLKVYVKCNTANMCMDVQVSMSKSKINSITSNNHQRHHG